MSKNPAFQYYPKDWRADAVWACSLAARGLWHEMMDRMHEREPYGYLVENGQPITDERIARMCGTTLPEYKTLLAELDAAGVPRRTPSGIIYCKRMVEDEKKRVEWRKRQEKHRDTVRDVTTMSRDSHTYLQSSSPPTKINSKPKTCEQEALADPLAANFALFWEAWPTPRKAKTSAWRVFKRIPVEEFLAIMAALEAQKRSESWRNPKFIPYPATWLNGKRWLDEVESGKPATDREASTKRTLDNLQRFVERHGGSGISHSEVAGAGQRALPPQR